MSSVGFRYKITDMAEGERPIFRIVYFVRSRSLGNVESFDLNEIIGLLASDELNEFIGGMFAELQELMQRAFAAGLGQTQWELSTEWDMRIGWQICMIDPTSGDLKFFGKLVEIENYLISNFRIQPSPQAFQADVHAPTIPLP